MRNTVTEGLFFLAEQAGATPEQNAIGAVIPFGSRYCSLGSHLHGTRSQNPEASPARAGLNNTPGKSCFGFTLRTRVRITLRVVLSQMTDPAEDKVLDSLESFLF